MVKSEKWKEVEEVISSISRGIGSGQGVEASGRGPLGGRSGRGQARMWRKWSECAHVESWGGGVFAGTPD